MKNALSLMIGLAFVFTLSAAAVAADKAPAAKPAEAAAAAPAGKEVTLKGDLGCGKCNFKTTKECQNVLKVTEDGKASMYYLAKNDISEKNHEAVCSGSKPATVTGTVSEDGKGAKKKKVLTASAIKID
jgi:hypothetical protein